MSNTRVIIGGNEMDLGEAVVAITKQANNIMRPESIQADYSNTITFPDTQRNRANLGFADEVGSETDTPYKILDAQIFKDGVEVVPYGKAELQSGNFDLDIYSGNRNFFDVLGDKSIQELDLSAFNHVWNYATVAANLTNTGWQDGFVYDLYDRGKALDLATIDAFDLFPSVFGRAIWEQIFIDAGFTYTGFTHPMFDKLLVPVNEMYQFPDDYRKAREFRVTTNREDLSLIDHRDNILEFDHVKDGFSVDSNGGFDLPAYTYTVDSSRLMTFEAGIGVFLQTESGSLRATLSIRVNGLVVSSVDFNSPDSGVGGSAEMFMTIATNPILVMPGDFVQAWVWIHDDSPLQVDPDWSILYHNTVQSPYFGGTVLPEFPREGQVILAHWLPDISQKDFVKGIHALFGMSFQTELYQDTIRVGQFKEVVDNIPNALDMSAMVHHPEQVRPSFKFGEFAQNNRILWKPDDTVADGFNDGAILVNDTTLKQEKDLIKLPFAATELSRTENVLSIPMFRAKANTAPVEYDRQKVQPRLVVQGSDTVAFTIVEYQEDGVTVANSSAGVRPVAYHVAPFKEYDLSIEGYIIPEFYSTLLAILDKTKVLPVQMTLSAEFIQNWDQAIPIWIDYWQQYFYVNKIEEYIDEASLTSVELIRL
jgi:hypothetical protein